jgi:ABC-type lipoprotein release transport system permease subunit
MKLIIKIAWRNLMRHRGKSLIIGAILFVGALLLTVGNGVVSGMNAGLQKNIVEGFCGDAVIVAQKQEFDNVFLEFMGKAVEPINNFKSIDSALKTIAFVDKWLPIGKNMGMALKEEGSLADGVFVLGIDWDRYRHFFNNNLKLIEGQFPDGKGPFVLIPTGWRKQAAEYYSILITPEKAILDTSTLGKESIARLSEMTRQHSVVYMGMSSENTTTDVRVPVRAIVKYNSLNTIWGQFPIMDIESYRVCMGYFSAEAKSAPVDKGLLDLLSTSNESLDDMFSDNSVVVASSSKSSAPSMLAAGSLATVRDTVRRAMDLDAGTFNIILLRLKKGNTLDRSVKALNEELTKRDLGARAIAWNKATGMIGGMAVLIKTILFAFVLCLFFVAIIIIMNTLSMAAIERTPEIGMMRAVGARKGFIRWMFVGETAALSAVFGGAGIIVGVIAVNIISALHFKTDIDMLQLLYGGDVFRPFLAPIDIGLAIIQLVIVTFLAVIYPLGIASRITPLDAISRE